MTTAFSNVSTPPSTEARPPATNSNPDSAATYGLLALGIIVALVVLVLFIVGFVRWWRKRANADIPDEVRGRLEANASYRREADAQEMETARNSNGTRLDSTYLNDMQIGAATDIGKRHLFSIRLRNNNR